MKCAWCNQGGGELVEITLDSSDRFAMHPRPAELTVHPEHEAAFRDFHAKVERHGKHFLLAVVGLLLAAVVVEVVGLATGTLGVGLLGIGLAVAAMGVVMIAWPFGTPETVRWLGLRATIRLTRYAGAALVLTGLAVLVLGSQQLG